MGRERRGDKAVLVQGLPPPGPSGSETPASCPPGLWLPCRDPALQIPLSLPEASLPPASSLKPTVLLAVPQSLAGPLPGSAADLWLSPTSVRPLALVSPAGPSCPSLTCVRLGPRSPPLCVRQPSSVPRAGFWDIPHLPQTPSVHLLSAPHVISDGRLCTWMCPEPHCGEQPPACPPPRAAAASLQSHGLHRVTPSEHGGTVLAQCPPRGEGSEGCQVP